MRFVVGFIVVAALVAQAFVAAPGPAWAQTPPPDDAVAISIGEVAPPVEGQSVAVPVTLTVDPAAGLDETVPLLLQMMFDVDAQPLTDATVAIAAATVTTDTSGVAEVAVSELGTWEELTSADGLTVDMAFAAPAGSVGVALQVVVPATETELEAAVSPVASYGFDVAPAGQTLAAAIESDYDQGTISADDAARISLHSAFDPTYRDERYAALYDDAVPEDPQRLALLGMSLWPELSKKTARELDEAYFAPTDSGSKGGGGKPSSSQEQLAAAAPTGGGGPSCGGTAPYPCTYIVDGAPRLEFRYRQGTGTYDVPAIDVDGDQIPDRLEDLTAKFHEAAAFFTGGLGMRPVDHTIVVWLHASDAGLSVPRAVGGGSVGIPFDAADYLVRHELFHQVEYEYLPFDAIVVQGRPMYWLLEAAAEWAAYRARLTLGTGDGRVGRYAADLPDALGRPHARLDETRDLFGGPEYGSFAFLEYLAQRHGGIATVEQVLIGSGGGIAGKRPTDVIADLVPSWEQAIVEYRQWTYLLERGGGYDVGFDATTPIDTEWRVALQADDRTKGSDARFARPYRTQQRDVSGTETFFETATAEVHPGGVRYYEFVLPQDKVTTIDIDLSTQGGTMQLTAMATGSYPDLCQAPVTREITPPSSTMRIEAGAGCDRLTLAVINTERPSFAYVVSPVKLTIAGTNGGALTYCGLPRLDLALVIDSGSSMATNDPDGRRLTFASRIADGKLPIDAMAVIEIDGTPAVAQPLTTDLNAVNAAIAAIDSNGSATTKDIGAAVSAAVDILESGPASLTQVLMFTDGHGVYDPAATDALSRLTYGPLITGIGDDINATLLEGIVADVGSGQYFPITSTDPIPEVIPREESCTEPTTLKGTATGKTSSATGDTVDPTIRATNDGWRP